MSLNDVSVVLSHSEWAWRWSWAKLVGSLEALHGKSHHGAMDHELGG